MSDVQALDSPTIWRPSYKQEELLRLPFSVFEGLFGGAAGGGKSELLVVLPLAYELHQQKKFKGIILRRTFPELEKEIIIRSKDFYSNAGGTWNDSKKFWKFPSGAHIFMGHAENEQDIRKYDGIEYNIVSFDELTHFTEFQYLYLVASRCRSSYPGGPAIARSTTNPGNIGHAWVRRRFVEPYIEGGKIIEDKITGHRRFYLHAKATDNPYLMKNDPGYVSRMELLPEAERRAKAYGDWFTYTGQVFDNFRIEPLPDEPENAKHVIEPFEIPDYWPKANMTDWGFKANTASLWGAISPDDKIYIYREYVVRETPVAVWGTEIGDFNKRERNLKVVGIDTNAWDQRGEDKTIAEQFEEFSELKKLNLSLSPASKARVSGKILIQEYLRWKQRPRPQVKLEFDNDYASLLLRHKGLDAYNDYLNQFKPVVDEVNLPKLQIFSTCTDLIRTIPLCIYDENNKEDVAEFEGDDVYDCLRYLLKAIVKYLGESKTEFEKIRKLDQLNKRLMETKDFTSYHMARAVLESRENKSFGVKRYHKGMRKLQNPGVPIEF